ncbi:MAG: hypothetical protein ACJ8BW_11495 [Ktedonobacteraceae bacterium]
MPCNYRSAQLAGISCFMRSSIFLVTAVGMGDHGFTPHVPTETDFSSSWKGSYALS